MRRAAGAVRAAAAGAALAAPGTALAAPANSMGDAIVNIGNLTPDLHVLLAAVCWAMGVFFTVQALLTAIRVADGRDNRGWGAPITQIVIGALLLGAPSLYQALGLSILGEAAPTYTSLRPGASGGLNLNAKGQQALLAVYRIVQFIGVVGIVKGLLILKAVGEHRGSATAGSGWTFIVAGVAAANIQLVVVLFAELLGVK